MPLTLAQALEEIEELKEEVRYLRQHLAGRYVGQDLVTLMSRYGLTPYEALIVADLSDAYPRAVQQWALVDRLPVQRCEARTDDANNLKVHISKIRKKIGKGSVETIRANGYRLGDGWKERIKGEPHAEMDQSPTPSAHAESGR